jgi:hypothetical protein
MRYVNIHFLGGFSVSQMIPALRFRVIYERNVALGMEMSFFASCPIIGGLSVPTQTLRTSNESMSHKAFVRVRQFEPTYRHVIIGACAKKDIFMRFSIEVSWGVHPLFRARLRKNNQIGP